MNRHSLIVHITIFFIFLMGVINTLFYFQYHNEHEYVITNAFKTFHKSNQILHMSRQERLPFDQAKERLYTILQVEMLHKKDTAIFQKGKLLRQDRDLKVYAYKQMIYLHFYDKRRGNELYLRYTDERLESHRIFLFALLIDLAVLLFFFYVIRRIWPLRSLKNSIYSFSRGNFDIDTKTDARDEIADVSNEFDKAIHIIKQLQASRNLFLRNVMHELKTPIAKGKLITDLLEDEKNAQRLSLIFNRFEYLLGEFSKIERVTSNEVILNKKRFRTVDILDNALDILMIEKESVIITIEAESEVNADFEMFSIALKNLIDNAMKYGTSRPEIIIEEKFVTVISSGKKLDTNLFKHVFNRKFEESSKGLGLGIYLTKSILYKHGFKLEYIHTSGINKFIICFL